jgi:anti-sigma-K factor RskA
MEEQKLLEMRLRGNIRLQKRAAYKATQDRCLNVHAGKSSWPSIPIWLAATPILAVVLDVKKAAGGAPLTAIVRMEIKQELLRLGWEFGKDALTPIAKFGLITEVRE